MELIVSLKSGIITWTPDEATPDTVYYQCFTHRYLGWKINVHDSCGDEQPQASERHEVFIDNESEPSIQHESKLFDSENFLKFHEKDLIKHHRMNNGTKLTRVTNDLLKTGELDKLITIGIKAAEELEDTILREQKQNLTVHTSNLRQKSKYFTRTTYDSNLILYSLIK